MADCTGIWGTNKINVGLVRGQTINFDWSSSWFHPHFSIGSVQVADKKCGATEDKQWPCGWVVSLWGVTCSSAALQSIIFFNSVSNWSGMQICVVYHVQHARSNAVIAGKSRKRGEWPQPIYHLMLIQNIQYYSVVIEAMYCHRCGHSGLLHLIFMCKVNSECVWGGRVIWFFLKMGERSRFF